MQTDPGVSRRQLDALFVMQSTRYMVIKVQIKLAAAGEHILHPAYRLFPLFYCHLMPPKPSGGRKQLLIRHLFLPEARFGYPECKAEILKGTYKHIQISVKPAFQGGVRNICDFRKPIRCEPRRTDQLVYSF